LFDTLDALLAGGAFASFAYLSQSERFQRRWPSLYAAVEDGQVDTQDLLELLVSQLPQQGVCIFPLDSSSWSRLRSRVLEDLQYVYQASSAVDGGNITVGYPYSLLEWCAEPHSTWSLPLDVRRIASQQTAQEVGVAQIQALAEARQGCLEALDIVPADGKYGNGRFLSRVNGLRVGIVARLRSDRVFYHTLKHSSGKRGRPSKYGQRFAFKDEQTWGTPDEGQEFEDEHYGKVRLQRWQSLRDKRTPNLTFDVLRAQVHLEKEKPPPAVWFAWLPPINPPPQIALTAQTIWTAYVSRWPIEPSLRFRKETLGWTLPRFHSAATGDTWTQLVALAHWMLFLSRPIVQDNPLPWQKAQTNLTPQRVRQSLCTIFLQIGTPARPPKPRGKSPGWQKGRRRTPKTRHKVVKKNASAT
ncbi:MAG: transposase, partial [Chloroflexota bacterium]